MKRNLLFLVVLLLTSVTSAFAQNEVYWREDFSPSGLTTDPAGSATVSDYTGTAGVWKFYNVWRTTGTACEGPGLVGSNGINYHVRSSSNTTIGASTAGNDFDDTAFLISPTVTKVINEVHLYRSRTNRRITLWKSADASVNTTDFTGWTLVSVLPKATATSLCADTTILVNDVNAKRVMFRFERAVNNDIDSIVVTSVLALPVKFTGLNASVMGSSVKVNWETATEVNIASYVVERSYNGRDFSSVANTPAKENGAGLKSYSWTDNAPLNGLSFYRIKAIEKDGQVTYTSIVKINTGSTKLEITVAPNPVRNGELNVQLSSLTKGTYSVRVFNNVGQVVFASQVSAEGGSLSQSFRLPSTVRTGVYTLQVTGNDVNLNRKIVIE
jgi:hypothetical protein